MNGFHGQLQKAKDDPLKWRDRRVKSPGSRYKRERERWKMASINFPPGDLHAFIKHEEEIGRDVFLSRSLIIFTLTGQTVFCATYPFD